MKQKTLRLTAKEEEVMLQFWSRGDMFVRELLATYPDPKPHFNTVSTVVRGLEEKGFLSHRAYGGTYQYFAAISLDEFKAQSLRGFIGKYYNNSIISAVSALVDSKAISSDELSELMELVERNGGDQ
ncbi:MAG: BlaI/MecI/CopY family transcriptional regulator [Rikenellaceae bacterium]